MFPIGSRHFSSLRPLVLVAVLFLASVVSSYGQPEANPCSIGWAQAPRVDPRNYYVNCFPEIGRMVGTITRPHFPGDGEEFGGNVYPLGDVNRDSLADWILTHRLADTSRKGIPVELLLYHGMKGGLPPVSSGQRIGLTELGSSTSFISAGDFDGNGYKDIVTYVEKYADTSVTGYTYGSLVVFWGEPSGYSVNDTTRLQCDAEKWLLVKSGVVLDANGDGTDDLMTYGHVGISDGTAILLPYIYLFLGNHGRKWGQDQAARLPSLRWWKPPYARDIAVSGISILDQDGDGLSDIAIYSSPDAGSNRTAMLSILYGNPGQQFPDTNASNIETIQFDAPDSASSNGSFSLLSDISGDSIPELLVMDGNKSTSLRIYIGLRGQRLRQQYGTGNEPEHPGEPVWWGKPWARVLLPNKINEDSWAHPFNVFHDLGDANFDGVKDIWMVSPPFLICYSGGIGLDNLIDGMADTRPGGSNWDGGSIKLLGDIDGSGVPAFTIGYDTGHDFPTAFPGGVKYFKMWDSIPWWGISGGPKQFPPYTLRSTIADVRSAPTRTGAAPLVMDARPNPSTGEVRLSWTIPADGASSLTISDESGKELERIPLESGSTSAVWSRSAKASGIYLATLRIRTATITTKVAIE